MAQNLKLIQGKQINVNLTGSFTGSFTGSLFGTSSFAITAGTSNNTNAVNGFLGATVDQINVGERNNGEYAYIVRAQELEQSKHATHNIYNNLNFT